MKSLSYAVTINAPRDRVWHDLMARDTYKEWTKPFSGNSDYDGDWKEGNEITFIDVDRGGTVARIEEMKKPERIHAVHVAIIDKDRKKDTQSDGARKWIGTSETYELNEVKNGTELRVKISTHEDYVKMFEDAWPNALEALKAVCER